MPDCTALPPRPGVAAASLWTALPDVLGWRLLRLLLPPAHGRRALSLPQEVRRAA
jgi:hypothetical protein